MAELVIQLGLGGPIQERLTVFGPPDLLMEELRQLEKEGAKSSFTGDARRFQVVKRRMVDPRTDRTCCHALEFIEE